MTDPFVHLHVASGYSLRYGASHPQVLVERAAGHGMDTLALTDRDGLYGAVRFALAAQAVGIRPVLGVDLAVETDVVALGGSGAPGAPGVAPGAPGGSGVPGGSTRSRQAPARPITPARGGVSVDPRLPRLTVLASGRAGWAALCRLVSATHLRGERGKPVTTPELIATYAAQAAEGGGRLLVLAGPSSPIGRAVSRRRMDLAQAAVRAWQAVLPDPTDLSLEVVSHRGPGEGPGSTGHAARTLALAHQLGVTAVLANQVRYADPSDAPVADVLDAARRLVPLDPRHLDGVNAQGYLKSGKEMALVAQEVVAAAGLAPGEARRLLAATRRVADRAALDPAGDLGLGLGPAGARFPETELVAPGAPVGAVPGVPDAGRALRQWCEAGITRRGLADTPALRGRLDHELGIIDGLGFAGYFLTVADVVDLVRDMGVRVAARGSGAGSLVTYLLGISGVDPLRHGLVMERFLSPRRAALPDIDLDVESARRTEIYQAILDRFGDQRVSCVSMMDTYRVRHAVRDVGAALGMPPEEIDTIAKAFPHIRARDARAALDELPELRGMRLSRDDPLLATMLRLVERLDGLPRHIALHPCGVVLSDATLRDRTPVEASWAGFPMSQFDKDDVEELGMLKLDVLGVRMQSAMAHAVGEVARVDGVHLDLDALSLDDTPTFELIQSTHTLGCFQIESPGQRELVGKFAPQTFDDLIIDISLFRPGPVKSDMVVPFLQARQGWAPPSYPHPDLRPVLEQTCGVVVFHEQVMGVIATMTGCDLAEADEARRALGDPVAKEEVRVWFPARALARGYDERTVAAVWEVLESFASFGFCKAHGAAFALPTYQSAWLKAHHPAAFLAGVLTHDPGMYPKRLILDDARNCGVAVLGLDVNQSDGCYRVERVGVDDEPPPQILGATPRDRPDWWPAGLPDPRGYGIRLSLADVKGISQAEVDRIVAGRPYASLSDFWHRARVSRPVVERLVVAGAFDALYEIGGRSARLGLRRRGRLTRRDLLVQLAELDRWGHSGERPVDGRRAGGRREAGPREGSPWEAGPRQASPRQAVQLSLDFDAEQVSPRAFEPSGLPEMTDAELVRAQLDVLGLDAHRHVLDFYASTLAGLHVVRARDLLTRRAGSELLVAGVKVATQTPPVRSGRRVVFLTLDDATGPVDATFFADAQEEYAATVFHSWLLLVRGQLRRTGPRGVSLRATGAWELTAVHARYQEEGIDGVLELLASSLPPGSRSARSVAEQAASRATRPVMARPPTGDDPTGGDPAAGDPTRHPGGRVATGGMGSRRRVLVHPSGFRQSPYADVRPAGEDPRSVAARASAPRRLWHSSPGSAGG